MIFSHICYLSFFWWACVAGAGLGWTLNPFHAGWCEPAGRGRGVSGPQLRCRKGKGQRTELITPKRPAGLGLSPSGKPLSCWADLGRPGNGNGGLRSEQGLPKARVWVVSTESGGDPWFIEITFPSIHSLNHSSFIPQTLSVYSVPCLLLGTREYLKTIKCTCEALSIGAWQRVSRFNKCFLLTYCMYPDRPAFG